MDNQAIARELVAVARELTANGAEVEEIENAIRDHLSGTPRRTDARGMFRILRLQFPELDKRLFKKAWDETMTPDVEVPEIEEPEEPDGPLPEPKMTTMDLCQEIEEKREQQQEQQEQEPSEPPSEPASGGPSGKT